MCNFCKGTGICIAPRCKKLISEALSYGSCSFYTANTPYLPLPISSPDGATTRWLVIAAIWWSLLLIYRPREDERLSWPRCIYVQINMGQMYCRVSSVNTFWRTERLWFFKTFYVMHQYHTYLSWPVDWVHLRFSHDCFIVVVFVLVVLSVINL